MPKGQKLDPDFWANVDVRGADECWLWLRGSLPSGYGVVTLNSYDKVYAHRRAYELAHGPIPEGMFICHSCDVPKCVNPAHLWVGTAKDNAQDMVRKGRGRRGRRKPPPPKYTPPPQQLKLTPQQVAEIRNLHALGGISMGELGRRFGVSTSFISLIINGKRRKSA